MSDDSVYPAVDTAFIEQLEHSFVELVTGEEGITRRALLGCLVQPLDVLTDSLAQADDELITAFEAIRAKGWQQIEFLDKFLGLLKLALEQLILALSPDVE